MDACKLLCEQELVPRRVLAHFEALPWCKSVIKEALNNGFRLIDFSSRRLLPSTENSLIAATFMSQETIPYALALFKGDVDTPQGSVVTALFSLGNGVNGHAHVVHGGFTGTVIDEVMGLVNSETRGNCFTAFLNITYKKPIPTPGQIVIRATITKAQGRKRFTSATVEVGNSICATADALFIDMIKSQKL